MNNKTGDESHMEKIDGIDDLLPNLKRSTENLSKLEDKDQWLNDIRGNDDELRQLLVDILKYLEHLETQQTLHDFFDKDRIRQALKAVQ